PFFEEYFVQRLKEQPENPLYSINLSQAYLNDGKHEQAEKAVKKLYQKYPNSSMLRMMMARIYQKRGETQRAKELFENIAATDKNYYYNNIQMINDSDLLSSKSISELEKIRDESLVFKHKYMYHLMDFLIATRKMDKENALQAYEALVESSANTEGILNAYSSVLYGITNDRERVIDFLEKRHKKSINEEVINELIKHYNLSGKKEKRAELLKDRAERYPHFYSMAQGYISYLNEEKDYQKVVSLTERGLQNFPYSFVLMEAQGNAYNQIKEV